MNKVKALFPDNVEKIIISKDDYDRLTGELTLENIELKQEIERLNKIIEIKNNRIQQLMKRTRSARIDKAIEYVENNVIQIKLNEVGTVTTVSEKFDKDEFLEILQGSDKE